MALVHTLVAEVLPDFIHALEAADNEALQVELGGNAEIEVHVERVVVGDEGASTGAAGYWLEDGGLYLRVAGLVERGAQRADNERALQEDVLHARIDDEVDIALAVAKLGIVEAVVDHSVLFLDYGQGLEAFGEQHEFLGMDGYFSRLCAEDESLHADEVSQVEQFLEHRIIERLVLARTNVVAGDVDLNAALGVEQLGKAGLAHHAAAHHAAGYADLAGRDVVGKRCLDVLGISVDGIFCCGIGIDAHPAEFFEGSPAIDFLLAEFKYVHCYELDLCAKLIQKSETPDKLKDYAALPGPDGAADREKGKKTDTLSSRKMKRAPALSILGRWPAPCGDRAGRCAARLRRCACESIRVPS